MRIQLYRKYTGNASEFAFRLSTQFRHWLENEDAFCWCGALSEAARLAEHVAVRKADRRVDAAILLPRPLQLC